MQKIAYSAAILLETFKRKLHAIICKWDQWDLFLHCVVLLQGTTAALDEREETTHKWMVSFYEYSKIIVKFAAISPAHIISVWHDTYFDYQRQENRNCYENYFYSSKYSTFIVVARTKYVWKKICFMYRWVVKLISKISSH